MENDVIMRGVEGITPNKVIKISAPRFSAECAPNIGKNLHKTRIHAILALLLSSITHLF
jgi:hypothetical protein